MGYAKHLSGTPAKQRQLKLANKPYMRRRVPDTSKIEALMGWQPTLPLDQTLDEVIEEFRQS